MPNQIAILYTTPSPNQTVAMVNFNCDTGLYGASSVPIPSSGISPLTYGVMQVFLSDGTAVVLYRRGNAPAAATVKSLYLATFTTSGGWANIDTMVATTANDAIILLSLFVDSNNRVHIAYQDQNIGGSIFTTSYKNWTLAGGLSSATLLGTDIHHINPAWTRGLHLKAADTICFLFHKSNNNVFEYTGTPSAAPVFSQTVVATSASQPDNSAPQPMSMLLNSTGTKRFAVWWASGTVNTISYDSNSGSGWSGVATLLLNVTAANWTLTSPDNGASLFSDIPTIAAVFDINGHFPDNTGPSFPETAVYLNPVGATSLVDAIAGENAEMVVSLQNVTGAPVFVVGSNLFVVLDYYEPTTGNERVSVWMSINNGATWTVQDDVHAPTRLPNSAVFLPNIAPAPPSIVGGGMGCLPQCIDPCLPVKAENVGPVFRGGDPAIMLALMAVVVALEGIS